MKRFFLLFTILGILTSNVFAHEVRPAYLELHQTGSESYEVLWKVPALGERRLALYIVLPAGSTNLTEPQISFASNSYIERRSVKRPGGLTGTVIRIAGLSATMTDVLVRLERLDGTTQIARLTPDKSSFVVEAAPEALEVVRTYLVLGVEHILLGIDHLLFVFALLILVRGWRRLVGTISAFTVAHSITLTAATLGFLSVPIAPVEAVIALSIAFVACEIIHRRQGRSGLTEHWPWIVSFTFGLLHGFGFASALHEVGLPQTAIPLALLFFNVGVELGQILFIAAVLALMFGISFITKKAGSQSRLTFDAVPWEAVAAYIIGTISVFWLIERTLRFLA